MLIYHGTNELVARKAINESLKPRICTGKSNWKHTIESNPNLIYLTTTYAPFFALSCKKSNEKFGIIEIDTDFLDVNNLFPDEDFIEQATRHEKGILGIKGNTIEQRTKWIRKNIEFFQPFWEKSIKGIGNCAYKGIIAPSAISRISIFNLEKCAPMCMSAMDPSITILNYYICKQKYQTITKWFMGDKVTLEEFDNIFKYKFNNNQEMEDYRNHWEKILNNREGIDIIYKKNS